MTCAVPGIASRIGIALLGLAAVSAACGPGAGPPQRLVVVVSVLPQAYFVERLAGDLVDIEVMVPPGASPSSYEPTIGQLRAMSEAALYVKVGHPNFPFEVAWLDKLLAEGGQAAVVDCTVEGLEVSDDPHVWLAPSCVRVIAPRITKALVELLPEYVPELESRLAAFLRDVDELDAELHARLDPLAGQKILVFHPAWSHFTKEYGIEQVAIEKEHKEPSSHELAELIEEARDAGYTVVFVQPQFSRQSAELVANEIGARVVVMDPLARDWLANLREVANAIEDGTVR